VVRDGRLVRLRAVLAHHWHHMFTVGADGGGPGRGHRLKPRVEA
jgi:hypothetical protein